MDRMTSGLKTVDRRPFAAPRFSGQFFLLGAILLCVLFFLGLPMATPLVRIETGDLGYVSVNVQRELPKALNLGFNESRAIRDLKNFTQFADSVLTRHLINLTVLWVVTRNVSTDVNVTIGNFLKRAENITLDLDGTIKTVGVNSNMTNSTTFSSVSAEFNLTISFDTESKTVTWKRDKANLYAMVNITRGENSAKEYVTA